MSLDVSSGSRHNVPPYRFQRAPQGSGQDKDKDKDKDKDDKDPPGRPNKPNDPADPGPPPALPPSATPPTLADPPPVPRPATADGPTPAPAPVPTPASPPTTINSPTTATNNQVSITPISSSLLDTPSTFTHAAAEPDTTTLTTLASDPTSSAVAIATEKARLVNIAAITGAVLGVIFFFVVVRVLYAMFRRPRSPNASRFASQSQFQRMRSPSPHLSSHTDIASLSTPVTVPSVTH